LAYSADCLVVASSCTSSHVRRVELRSTKTRVDQAPLEQGPVSIRRRRVHSPLRLEWGPKARPSYLWSRDPVRAFAGAKHSCRRDERQIVLRRLSGTASLRAKPVGRYHALAGAGTASREPLRSPARSSPAFTTPVHAHASNDTSARGPEPCKCSPHKGEVNADALCLEWRTRSRSSRSLLGDQGSHPITLSTGRVTPPGAHSRRTSAAPRHRPAYTPPRPPRAGRGRLP